MEHCAFVGMPVFYFDFVYYIVTHAKKSYDTIVDHRDFMQLIESVRQVEKKRQKL